MIANTQDHGYSTHKASMLAYMAKNAYLKNTQLIKTSHGDPFVEKYPLLDVEIIQQNQGALRCFVARTKNSGQIIISFRGSNNFSNWFYNLDAFYLDYPNLKGGKIHEGFYQSYQTLRPKILKKLQKLLNQDKIKKMTNLSILTTGHSLGGALACLCAINLRTIFPQRQVELYTFGQPRIGNRILTNYAKQLIGTVYLVIHDNDPVPHLPPANIGYQHIGKQVYYNQQMDKFQINDANKSVGAFTIIHSFLSLNGFDHSSNIYAKLKIQQFGKRDIPIGKIKKHIQPEEQYHDISNEYHSLKLQPKLKLRNLRQVNSSPNSYDTLKASICIHMSKIAYCQPDYIKKWTKPQEENLFKFKLTDISVFQDIKTNGLFFIGKLKETNQIVISFRGTQPLSWKNWKIDINVIPIQYKKFPDMKVHPGFFNGYQALRKKVNQQLKVVLQKYPNSRLLVTGHSLGGALAVICSLDLKEQYPKIPLQLYTFGQPRVGNKQFCDYGEKIIDAIYLIIHDKDIIPHHPYLGKFYHHMGLQVHYNEQMNNYQINEAEYGVGAFTKWIAIQTLLIYELNDHSSNEYIALKVESQNLTKKYK